MKQKPLVKKPDSFFSTHIDYIKSKDAGLVIVLICLLIGYFHQSFSWIGLSIIILIIDLILPQIFKPFAVIWWGLSTLLSTIMSKLILSLTFYFLITPVGLTRKIFGADPLKLKKWKKGKSSVFVFRNHKFQSHDIEKPF